MAVEMTQAIQTFPTPPLRKGPPINGYIYLKSSTTTASIYKSNGMEFARGGTTLTNLQNTHPWLGFSAMVVPDGSRSNPLTGATEKLYMRIG